MKSLLKSLALAGVAALAMPASIVRAASGDVVPFRVPPGGFVSIEVFGCAAGTTTIVIDVAPQGGAAFVDDSAAAIDGGAHFDERVPIDAALGTYEVHVMCKDLDATTIDTAVLTFEVANLGLQMSPTSGPLGTRIHITGSGCPVGVTDRVFAFIDGAGDDQPVWDPTRTDGVNVLPNVDGSFSLRMTVPSRLPTGENLVSVYCVSEGGSALAGPFLRAFTVTEGSIPPTGAASSPMVWLAFGLLATGGCLLIAMRLLSHRRGSTG